MHYGIHTGWRNDTLAALPALCEGSPRVTVGFPSQRASNVGLDHFFVDSPNKLLSQQAVCRCFRILTWHHNAMDTDKTLKITQGRSLKINSMWPPDATKLSPYDTKPLHYNDVIMSALASQITNLTIVYSTVYSGRRSKKAPRLRVTGLCAGNSLVTGEFPAQRASNTENVSIWWRHHDLKPLFLETISQITFQCFLSLKTPLISISKVYLKIITIFIQESMIEDLDLEMLFLCPSYHCHENVVFNAVRFRCVRAVYDNMHRSAEVHRVESFVCKMNRK